MKVEKFAQKVVEQFCKELTDQMFLYIENNKDLMQEYLHLVSEEKLENVNRLLGSEFKKKFFVDNYKENVEPKSKLIVSYTEHTTPQK
jgi:hypothetical protein